MEQKSKYNRARLDDRQMTELIGMARGMIADGDLNDREVHFLHKWLAANEVITANPVIAKLVMRIEDVLADGVIDDEERADLIETLTAFTASDFELGEVLKATTIPLCDPTPNVLIPEHRFTFTGTFTFGTRKDCEAAIAERGGLAGSLTKSTRFLVIGEYATDSWAQSSFGRKIEKAAGMRDAGIPINLISEAHWRTYLD